MIFIVSIISIKQTFMDQGYLNNNVSNVCLINVTNIIRDEIIRLYDYHDQDFDVDKYNRIVNNMVNSISLNYDINNEKLALYYASLLYPINNINFYSYGDETTRKILKSNNIHDNNFIELILSVINYKYINNKNNNYDLSGRRSNITRRS